MEENGVIVDGNTLLALIDGLALAAAIAVPGSQKSLLIVAQVTALTASLRALMAGEKDIHLETYEETLAKARATLAETQAAQG